MGLLFTKMALIELCIRNPRGRLWLQGQLKEATIYLRSVSQNATSFSGRFRDLAGLQMLLQQVVHLHRIVSCFLGALD